MMFSSAQTINYWLADPQEAVAQALKDLQSDFQRVLRSRLQAVAQPGDAHLVLANLSLTSWPGLKIKAGQWECYQIAIIDNQVIIAGSDTRGLLFGIYQFSQRALAVDPLWFWIPENPKPLRQVDPSKAVIISETPTFRYRGWFINGEDLLEEWHYGTDRQGTDWYGLRHKVISYETYERIFEAMLRLRVNVIIPATVMDISVPEDAEVYRRIRRRGLMFSQHHIEPVGVCPSHAFRNYCRRKKIDENFSWIGNRPIVEACWREYIDRTAEYADSVVWQLGYRGAGDRPFWRTEAAAPKDMAGRADVISRAIGRQYELIRERLGTRRNIPCTTTLWWEGGTFYKQGLLRLPEEVIVVISDVARQQMLPKPLPASEPGRRYGIYYHTSYWSTGPQLIQGNPPANVFANYRTAIQAGACEYSMQHVSNVRPFLPVVQAVAELTFNSDAFDDDAYMADFCKCHFGDRHLAKLYDNYFKAFVHREEADLQQQNARWLDGAIRMVIKYGLLVLDRFGQPNAGAFTQFMNYCAFGLQILRDNSATIHDLADSKNPNNWLCTTWKQWYAYAAPMLRSSLNRWQNLVKQVENLRPSLMRGKELYDSNLYWQSLVGRGLTSAAVEFLEALCSWVDGQTDVAGEHFDRAAACLDGVIAEGPNLAEQEHFRGWTAGDRYMNLSSLRDELHGFHQKTATLSGNPTTERP